MCILRNTEVNFNGLMKCDLDARSPKRLFCLVCVLSGMTRELPRINSVLFRRVVRTLSSNRGNNGVAGHSDTLCLLESP